MFFVDTAAQLFNSFLFGLVIVNVLLVLSWIIFKNRRHWLLFWLSFLCLQGLTWSLKFIVDRVRPTGQHHLMSPSFPSGAAADAGFFAMYASILYPKYVVVWHGAGFFVALLRIHIGAHYVSDVVAGYLLGVLVAYALSKLLLKRPEKIS